MTRETGCCSNPWADDTNNVQLATNPAPLPDSSVGGESSRLGSLISVYLFGRGWRFMGLYLALAMTHLHLHPGEGGLSCLRVMSLFQGPAWAGAKGLLHPVWVGADSWVAWDCHIRQCAKGERGFPSLRSLRGLAVRGQG